MGVQDVVARLNKSKLVITSKSTTLPLASKRNIMTDGARLPPPSPAASPISTIAGSVSSSNRSSSASNGIASMMQRFERSSPSPTPSQTTTYKLPLPAESQQQQQQQQQSQQRQKKVNVTRISKGTNSLFRFDSTASDIVDLFQSLIDQNAAAEEYIKTLKQDVEKFSSDATKVRDYEIRVEYLALKLEQVSEERDYFEKELNEQKQNVMFSSPLTPAFSQIGQQDIVIEDEQRLQNQNNDAYMADLLNVYQELSDGGRDEKGDDLRLFDEQSASQIQSQREEIDMLNDKLIACDRGVQMTLMKYVADLETQRLETKALKQVVRKQDELIIKLEAKIHAAPQNFDELLKEQVEVQAVELDNKRELLTQLLNEREDLLRRLNSNQRNSLLRRSSIDLLTNIIRNRPGSFTSTITSSSSGRGTPPLTAPPRQPLPPLPSSN